MKKRYIFAIVLVFGVLIISSCHSRSNKCPGMYSQLDSPTNSYYQIID